MSLGHQEHLWRKLQGVHQNGSIPPAERARIVRLLVERVDVGPNGADIRLRVEGLAGLVRDLGASSRAERLTA